MPYDGAAPMTRAPDIRYAVMTLEHYERAFALWRATPGIGVSAADTRGAIARYLERNPGSSFVATRGDAVVGTVLGGHDRRRGYLHHLAVAADCRGLGIGAELVRRCIAALSREGLDKTHLFVHADNELGLGFWRRAGWQQRDDIVMFSHANEGQEEAAP